MTKSRSFLFKKKKDYSVDLKDTHECTILFSQHVCMALEGETPEVSETLKQQSFFFFIEISLSWSQPTIASKNVAIGLKIMNL